MKQLKYLILFIPFVLINCTTSRITSTWKAENIQAKRYNKILVLGLIREADRSIREKMEEHLVGDMRNMGYNAICACDEYGPKAFENMTEKEALNRLTNSGIDAVLTVVLLDKTKERYYIPARVYYSPYYNYHNRFWGYYTTMHDRIYSKGYYEVSTKYFWESNLYDMDSKQLVYSVQTQTFDPSSSETLAHEYGQLIVSNMVKNKVLSSVTPAESKSSIKPF
jgi:hypothetical protein